MKAASKPTRSNKSAPVPIDTEGKDMLALLQDVALGKLEVTPTQLRAAIAAVQYTHTKTKDGGKKEARQKKAEDIAQKFQTATPPKLVAVGGGKR